MFPKGVINIIYISIRECIYYKPRGRQNCSSDDNAANGCFVRAKVWYTWKADVTCPVPPTRTPDLPVSCCEKAIIYCTERTLYTQLCHRLRPRRGGCNDKLSLCRHVTRSSCGGKTVCRERYHDDGVNQSFPRLAETLKLFPSTISPPPTPPIVTPQRGR